MTKTTIETINCAHRITTTTAGPVHDQLWSDMGWRQRRNRHCGRVVLHDFWYGVGHSGGQSWPRLTSSGRKLAEGTVYHQPVVLYTYLGENYDNDGNHCFCFSRPALIAPQFKWLWKLAFDIAKDYRHFNTNSSTVTTTHLWQCCVC